MHLRLVVLTLVLWPAPVGAQVVVSSNDNKAVLVDGVNTVPPNARPDSLTIIDLGVSPPRVVGTVAVPGGWSAPPQSVAVSPDESLALVTSSARLSPDDHSRTVVNDEVTVVDLRQSPPAVVQTLRTGARVSGVSISPDGTLALVANRGNGTVSVFRIEGLRVTPAGVVTLGGPDTEPALPVFAPDGRTAYVTRYGEHRIAVLEVEGGSVRDTGRNISANLRPYSMELTPSGEYAVVGNIGNGPTGGADTVSLIHLTAEPPRLVDAVTVGLIPEGIGTSPDGVHVGVCLQNGANLPAASPFHQPYGLLKIFRIADRRLVPVAEARIGRWCQGVAWNRSGDTVIVQAAADRVIQMFRFDGRSLAAAGAIEVDGAPTGLRTAGVVRPPRTSGVLREGGPGAGR